MLAVDYLEEIAWSFRKQKLRTALTSIGIAIGAFAIAIMVGLGQGVQSYIESQILAFGNPRVVMVFPESARFAERILDRLTQIGRPARPMGERDEEARRVRRGGLWISPEQVEKLRALPGVAQVAPLTWLEIDGIALAPPEAPAAPSAPAATPGLKGREGPAAPGAGDGGGEAETFYETDYAALSTHPLVGTPSAGRLPRSDAAEVIVSPQYAESLRIAPEALAGRGVVIRVPKLASVQERWLFRDPTQYHDEHRLFRATIVGLAERSPASRAVYASLALGREMARYQSQNPDILSDQKIGFQAHVRIAGGADPDRVKAEIRKIGLVARSVDEQIAEVTRSFLVVKIALSLFGLIAVLVATLGIANTLLMAISERTREIGVMKALGATEPTIRRMFAAEAAAIGLGGGVLGTLAAVALGSVLNVVAQRYLEAESFQGFRAFTFPWWLVAGAIVFAMAIGVLAGLYPANRAARLDPIEALRHE